MPYVPDTIEDPFDPESVQEAYERVAEALNLGLDEGEPPTAAGENGKSGNLSGGWARVTFTNAAPTQTCTHNLAAPTQGVSGSVSNVYWTVRGVRGSDNFQLVQGGTPTADSIDLTMVPTPAGDVTVLLRFRVGKW